MIHQMLFTSLSRHPRGHGSDIDILSAAMTRNRQIGITGFLLRESTGFCQVIEGTEVAVRALFALIERRRKARGRAANAARRAAAGSRDGGARGASFAQPTPGLDDDDDVDWTTPVQPPPGAPDDANNGRPMTPTRLPGSGL